MDDPGTPLRRRPRWFPAVLSVRLLGVIVGMLVVGGLGIAQLVAGSAAGGSAPLAAPDEPESSRIKYLLGSEPVYIDNGGAIPIGAGLAMEVFVSPYPPARFDVDLDLHLTRSGEPVEGATVQISYDMMFMGHGPYEATPVERAQGHYGLSLDLSMYGSWVFDITVEAPGGVGSVTVPVAIYVWPEAS